MQELASHVHTAVLVEGDSDRCAVEALARRHGRRLDTEGVAVVAIGGATNAGHAARAYGPTGRDLRLAALCDVAEVGHFARAHEPWRSAVAAGAPAAAGLFVCDADLEDELIRAIGTDAMVPFVEAQGEGPAFSTFQRQPYQRGRPLAAQLRRFIGTKSGRKIHYGAALVEAIPLEAMPEPLRALLAFVG
jgi:Overcoming lysogenization defect protein-like, TOPRIM domain